MARKLRPSYRNPPRGRPKPPPPLLAAICPKCGRQKSARGGVGAVRRALLCHLRDAHGPLPIVEVRAFHALNAQQFRAFLAPA